MLFMPHVYCEMLKVMMPSPMVQHKIGTRNSRKIICCRTRRPLSKNWGQSSYKYTAIVTGFCDYARWTTGRHLHELGKTSKRCREVPHNLTAKQQNGVRKFEKNFLQISRTSVSTVLWKEMNSSNYILVRWSYNS